MALMMVTVKDRVQDSLSKDTLIVQSERRVMIFKDTGQWTLLVIVKDTSSHLMYLNMHKITKFELKIGF